MGQSESAGSGGGGASCFAALAHLALHHHLSGDAGDLTVGHGAWDPHPEETKREGEGQVRVNALSFTGVGVDTVSPKVNYTVYANPEAGKYLKPMLRGEQGSFM